MAASDSILKKLDPVRNRTLPIMAGGEITLITAVEFQVEIEPLNHRTENVDIKMRERLRSVNVGFWIKV